jgi:hypothetical protein
MLCSFFNSAAAVSHGVNSKEGGLYQSLCHYKVPILESLMEAHILFLNQFVEIPSEIYHGLLLVSFGKSRFKYPTI